VDVVKAADVNWEGYFLKIKQRCPWSWAAWHRGLVDIVKYNKNWKPLGVYQARIHIVKLNKRRLKKLCKQLDQGEYEWLWSEPSYGKYATPVACLIQQDRQQLNDIRKRL
jgi:hypothetical protein